MHIELGSFCNSLQVGRYRLSKEESTKFIFRNTALPIIDNLMEQGKVPFICGGTNYYIESLLWKEGI